MTDTETARLHDEILTGKAEIAKLRDLLTKENKRANQAIDREETAEQAAEEAHAELKHAHAALARIRQMADHWEQHLPEVIRTPAVVSALRAALDRVSSAVVAPPTDQTALRDRIAEALLDHLSRTADIRTSSSGGELAFMPEVTDAERVRMADAVLAGRPAPADRAAVLREAADRVDNEELPHDYVDMFDNGARWAARLLRRMADETATETPERHHPVALATPCTACGHPYNWHTRLQGGCEFAPVDLSRCGCTGFVPGERPEPVDPWHILGIEADDEP